MSKERRADVGSRQQPAKPNGEPARGQEDPADQARDLELATTTAMPAKNPLRSQAGRGRGRPSTAHELDESQFSPGALVAGRYRILTLLGRGGMGEVYRADDLKLSQPVALKFLPRSMRRDEARLARLLDELKIARKISHPNVCRVYDVGEARGHQFISMEYIDGENLAVLLRQIGRFPKAKAIEIGHQLCRGLSAAHQQGILHRDLKPANLMIDGRGSARITDFGIAVLADHVPGDELLYGTPAYMAPEQIAGQEATVQSDLYVLGLVLYKLFTGQAAFRATSQQELIELQRETSPAPPSRIVEGLDPVLEQIILRCLSTDPQDRPSSADAVASALLAPGEQQDWRPKPDASIPHRSSWVLEKKLGEGGFGEVWLANHRKTRDRRVFKFCHDVDRLRTLQREITVFRLLKEELGDRDDIVRILDWSFEEPPYFIESEYTAGGNLVDWANQQGGIAAVPLAVRLEIVAQVATALAAAHSVGVLHKDVKPPNVLIHHRRDADPSANVRAQLTDFGLGAVTEQRWLAKAGITALGMTGETKDLKAGTQLYMAPELIEGKAVTVQVDIYALGVMLYQMVVGDFSHALAPGWRRDVDDEILRDDIAAAVDGSPERRLGNALWLAERLRSLESRRAERLAEQRDQEETERLRKMVERSRRRRRLAAVVITVLILFAGTMASMAYRVSQEAKRANHEALTAARVSAFLVDMFEAPDPFGVSVADAAPGAELTAREILDRGVQKLEIDLEDQPELRARLMGTIGEVYRNLGSLDAAESLIANALELRREMLDEDNLEVAESLNALADLLWLKGDYEHAEPLARQALRVRRQLLGEVHLSVADSLRTLASVLWYKGDLDEAEQRFRETLKIRRQLLGDDHPDIAWPLSDLAGVLHVQGDSEGAKLLLYEALAIYRRAYGEHHPHVATVQDNLATLLTEQHAYEAAEPLFRQALATRREILGDEHPHVATTLNSLAVLFIAKRDYAAAEPLLRQALAMNRQLQGEEHPRVAVNLANLARLLRLQSNPETAERLIREALAMNRRLLGEEHYRVARNLDLLARLRVTQGAYAEAQSLILEALKIHRKTLPEDHWRISDASAVLGASLAGLGRGDEAEPLLLQSYLSLRDHQPEATRDTLEYLVSFYHSVDKPEQAAKYRALWLKAGER